MHSESSSGPIVATKLHREDRLELKKRSVPPSTPHPHFSFFPPLGLSLSLFNFYFKGGGSTHTHKFLVLWGILVSVCVF